MTIHQEVTEIVDETIQALTHLDLDRLQSLERRMAALAKSDLASGRENLETILAKKRLLGFVLQNCESNLDALKRLHRRNARDQWAH
jgi:vacuolar-type H+-ATPase subunit H